MQRPNNRRLTADSLESPAHMPSTGIRIDISAINMNWEKPRSHRGHPRIHFTLNHKTINTDPRVQKECESREQQLSTELHDDAIPAWGAIRDRTTSPPRYICLPPIRQSSTGALPPLRRTLSLRLCATTRSVLTVQKCTAQTSTSGLLHPHRRLEIHGVVSVEEYDAHG